MEIDIDDLMAWLCTFPVPNYPFKARGVIHSYLESKGYKRMTRHDVSNWRSATVNIGQWLQQLKNDNIIKKYNNSHSWILINL